MNWLTEFVRPKIRTLFARREAPDNLWHTMSRLPADDLPSRPAGQPEGLPALRPPHARRRHRAAGLDASTTALHPHRAAQGTGRSAALPRHQALHRPAEGGAREDPPRRCDRRRARQHRRASRGGRGDGLRLHRRLDGGRGRRGHRRRGAAGGVAGGAADRVHRLGRGAHAGGRDQPDADAAHGDRDAPGEGGRPALHRRADRSHHRRRHRQLRHAGRHPDRRARRADRLRRRAGDRADRARKAARRLPARRISAPARHRRHGGASAPS